MIYEQHIKDREEVTLYGGGYDKNLRPGVTYGPVIRDVYVIECCTGGRGSVIINGKEFPLKARDCFFLFPGDVVVHTADNVQPREGIWCTVEGLNIGAALKAGGITNKMPFAPPEAFDKIYESVEKLILEKEEMDIGSQFRHASYIYDIIGAVLEMRTVPKKNIWVERAISLVAENYFDKELTVGTLALKIGLERTYFSSLFKKSTGYTYTEYLNAKKIGYACAIMNNKKFTLTDIALSSGFVSLAAFNRTFKSVMGTSPKEYRLKLYN